MVINKTFKILFSSILVGLVFTVFLFFNYNESVNAQCSFVTPAWGSGPSSSGWCCYGACASGYTQVASGTSATNSSLRHLPGYNLCCATGTVGGTCSGTQSNCDCLTPNCKSTGSTIPSCNNCVLCRTPCNCHCNSCSAPTSCPGNLVTKNTGCFRSNERNLCTCSCNFSHCNCSPASMGCYSSSLSCYDPPVSGRDATCGPSHQGGVYSAPTGTQACGSGSTRSNLNIVSAGTLNLISSQKYTWTCIGEDGRCTGPKGANINCEAIICKCPCDCTDSVPQCPSGTSTANTGDLCGVPGVRSRCTGTCNHSDCTELTCRSAYNNSCYVEENAPVLPTPNNINMTVRRRSGVTSSGDLTSTPDRVPYPGNTGRNYNFRVNFHQNPRQGDFFNGINSRRISWSTAGLPCVLPFCRRIDLEGQVFKVYGQRATLTYRYRLGSNSWSPYLDMNSRYTPGIQLSEGNTYTIRVQASLLNRCQGSTESGILTNRFKVNHKPEVIDIEPVANPNDDSWGANPNLRVSGNINRDASQYNMSDSAPGTDDTFHCTIDNPKYFEVTFRDEDGCADINPYVSNPTDINNPFRSTRSLNLRAVDSSTGGIFATGSILSNTVSCEPDGKTLKATFSIQFTGNHNRHLNMEAAVVDVLGNMSYFSQTVNSIWVHPSGATWSYDARPPLPNSIYVDEITGPQEIRLAWTSIDDLLSLSGVRFLRTYGMLSPGTILRHSRDYGPFEYDGIEVPVNEHFNMYHRMKDVLDISAADARSGRPHERRGDYLVDIGKNQDGHLHFRLVSVDRACNYQVTDIATPFELGSPWIATRGGFVYSDGPIHFPNRNVNYGNILSGTDFGSESAAISSEWLGTLAHNSQISGPLGSSYISSNYPNNIVGGMYQTFYDIANRRDPEGDNWTRLNSDDLQDGHLESSHLNKCKDGYHVYFINSSLEVNPRHYEELGVSPGTGCIFVVRDNVSIGEGSYKSGGVTPGEKPGYDLVRGFFIVDGEINIEFADRNREVRDGLKVVGSLIAFDNPGGESSIRLRRSLQLRDNLSYPILIVFHDPRYMDIAREAFGATLGGGYIRDVGFME